MANFCEDLFDAFDEQPEEAIPVAIKKEIDDDEKAALLNTNIKSEEPDLEHGSRKRPREENDGAERSSKQHKMESILDDINISELNQRIKIHIIETKNACTHEVALPPDQEYQSLVKPTGKPAREYKFVLDPFQEEAILCIENNQSVLVSAHTSAGKTVVAEYSIAKSLLDKQRVIYTTPIKALSNQKYREFTEEFKDVGLITGDVTINPGASILIMTTEILRNMLYRGSEVMREVGWVVFDEIHYMRDKERGVVWEETLILLPDNVHYVFLSATIPNARQFAEWVAHLHHQPCHVVYTDYRPTPLQHYIFPAGGDGIHLVLDENGQFREDNFNTAMAVLQNAGDAAKGDAAGRRGGNTVCGRGTNAYKIVKMIMERNFAPVICFSFSKKDCEIYAMQMAKLDFNTVEEKKLVAEVFSNAMDVLSEEDRKLPQVENVLPLLKRGIGIHHGGLLPILKETIEILFAEGLIKALFATETFAMGLNMPARTVLFTGCRKFDGKNYRFVTSGEYIQMSGRAGRRGLDDKGIVILMIDEQVSPAVGREIVNGAPDAINSAFHLTYNMVLNLLRVEEINPEYMLERSFYQFQNQSAIPGLYERVKKTQEEYDSLVVPKESQVASYYAIREQLDQLGKQFQSYLIQPNYLIPFLHPGRLIKVKTNSDEFDWGMVVNFRKQEDKTGGNPLKKCSKVLIIDTLLNIARGSSTEVPKACPPGEKGLLEVIPVHHTVVTHISSVRMKAPNDLRSQDSRKNAYKTIQEIKKRFPKGIPLLDPISDMNIKEEVFIDIVKRITAFEERLYNHPLHNHPDLVQMYKAHAKKEKVGTELKKLKEELKAAKSLLQMNDLKSKKRVLRRMDYCTASDVIELKGRVACELSCGHELLLTELIFNGVFNSLTIPQSVALLSCFVCDEKGAEIPRLTEELAGPLRQMQDLARHIARVSNEAKVEMDEDAYVDSFKPYLMDVFHAWCNGVSFSKICQMTTIYEGSIIRAMRRCEEMLRQIVQAAKNIGDASMEEKFNEAIRLIKRDIVFAASLYL
ncbi:UNVERIFIED_CONTAM: hypothetical protein PYX00_001132 [Menopon gallinae]|uniref:Exosome RNA helicase MTR4 n=1 Tax=Menopon gallinae TaxID=328185 RepID=A0AAW2IBZ8_9NEOP